MNNRLYPFSEDYFKEHIHPHILSFKDGRGRPAKISGYQFFCAVLYVLRTAVAWRDLPGASWHTI